MPKEKQHTLFEYANKYIKQRMSSENYAQCRAASGLPICGVVSYDDLIRARTRAAEHVKQLDALESWRHVHQKQLRGFLKAFGVDTAVFKKGRQYAMTEAMMHLADYVWDDLKGVTVRVKRCEWERISDKEYYMIYSLVIAAIKDGPATLEAKRQAIDKFSDCIADYVKTFTQPPEYYRNEIVEKILKYIRSEKPIDSIDELEWEIVTERVYKYLLDTGILVIDQESASYAPGSRLTMR